jgi:hypothetical protein
MPYYYDLPEGSFTIIFDEASDFDCEPVEKHEEPEMIFIPTERLRDSACKYGSKYLCVYFYAIL